LLCSCPDFSAITSWPFLALAELASERTLNAGVPYRLPFSLPVRSFQAKRILAPRVFFEDGLKKLKSKILLESFCHP
jgi:hypothetical protein